VLILVGRAWSLMTPPKQTAMYVEGVTTTTLYPSGMNYTACPCSVLGVTPDRPPIQVASRQLLTQLGGPDMSVVVKVKSICTADGCSQPFDASEGCQPVLT
jgi:hypothetical protein